jgi:hypothetical protein
MENARQKAEHARAESIHETARVRRESDGSATTHAPRTNHSMHSKRTETLVTCASLFTARVVVGAGMMQSGGGSWVGVG